MSDMNLTCKHKQIVRNPKEKIDFCKKCGCFIVIKYSDKHKEVDSYSILPRKMITPLDISPYDTIKNIIRQTSEADLSNDFKNLPEEYITLRKSLISLLKDYIVEYSFSTRSYFLGIYILDFIFCKYSYSDIVSKLKTDLLVLGVFLAAVKYIDDDAYPPGLDTFANKKNPSIFYSLNEVRRYEFMVVKLINYKMDIFTSYYLTETILSHGIIFTYEIEKMGITSSRIIKDTIKKLYRLSLDINKMFIEDINSIKFNALEISSTCIMMAKELLKFEVQWNPELQYLLGIDAESLNICYNAILKAYENSQYHTPKKPIEEKYTSTTDNKTTTVRASTRFASSTNVLVSGSKLLSNEKENEKETRDKNKEKSTGGKNKDKDRIFTPIVPIDEFAEFDEQRLKVQAPDNMQEKILNSNKIVSLNDKDLLSKDDPKVIPASKRFSTKEVFKIKEALNTKK